MKYMTEKYFLDTNFIVYLFSEDEKEKKKKCHYLFEKLKDEARLVISTQVLKEFTAILISKFKLDPIFVKRGIDNLSKLEVVHINTVLIKNAIDIHILNQLSFWDALIVSAAKSANCNMILTEDINDGQVIDGIKVQSPFTFKVE